jgi:superfamily II DNA/RNA helicase
MKFEETYLNDNILDALYDMHFDDMTPIQERCIPEILDGYDVLGVAQTGTGKTAAYLLPILSMLDDGDYPKDAINCVIMSPTRELAQQIDQAMQGFGYYLDDVSSVAVYGGNDGGRYEQELRGMRLGADVLIATPGRLLSHMKVGNLDLSRCSFFVLDEADRMLDMGFSESIDEILSKVPRDRNTLLFSATMSKEIEKIAVSYLRDYKEIVVGSRNEGAENVNHIYYLVHAKDKYLALKRIVDFHPRIFAIIFCRTKIETQEIADKLIKDGYNAE